jgi:hypothetical protein
VALGRHLVGDNTEQAGGSVSTERLAGLIATPRTPTPVRWAVVISVSPTTAKAVVRPSNATATDGSQDVTAAYLMASAPAVGALVRIEAYQGDVVILGSPAVDAFPGSPFAMSAGSALVSIAAAATGNVNVTFPAGRFTQAPIVTTNIGAGASSSKLANRAVSVTTSGANLQVYTGDGTAVTVTNLPIYFIAVQMTSTNASG